jgi:serine phosphatase RsbU (regulator of sigma subunit)
MDAAFCMYDKKKGKLYFSGGFINMVIIRNGEIIEIASDKCPIGAYPIENPFTLNEFQLEEDDVISLYSDGYVDQFGYDKTSTRIKPTKFKRKRLQALLLEINHLTCEEQVEKLSENLKDWSANLDQIDDITVFLARHIN